jgi:hypothetical protein
MTRLLLASTAMFGLIAGSAMAQSMSVTTSAVGSAPVTTTTVTGPAPITPPSPPGTITMSSTNGQMFHADGDKSITVGAGSSNDRGTSNDVVVTTKTYPFSNLITTTKKTISVNNGVATQTTATTQTYPRMAGFAGSTSTTEKTETLGSK